MWTTKLLKERFIRFFEKHGHTHLPSSSVIPRNDPTLLFTNSGMVQFKGIFMGEHAKYKRVCTSQRCIRAGGKHNDLDDVGKDNYHHTFFEMLGNWSFGDYFKEDAIRFAYEFLVEDLKLDKDSLYVTIYEEMDKESRSIWSKYLSPSRIISSSYKDNFWEMGEFGPCGPCTEIHYDRIGNRDASSLVNRDDPDVLEIWNIVFMEYERTPKGLEPLKVKNIDTGIGLERLLSILMGVRSNYLIDSFQHIIKAIESRSNFTYEDKMSIVDVAFRVLADHTRTIAVCLNDRVAFSSEGAGYVLRRILRRAVRYSHDILNLEKGVLSQLVAKAAEFMGLDADVSVVDSEENLFFKTLVKGEIQFNKIVQEKGKLEGPDIFLLYDTYGFPKDLTELMATEKNIPIHLEGFEEAKNRAKELSKSTKSVITINFDFEKTDDSFKYTELNGIDAKLMAAVLDNEIVSVLPNGQISQLVFDRTCFYGKCGGQVGDKGVITFYDESKDAVGTFDVQDTQIQRGYVLHEGVLTGSLSPHAVLTYDSSLRSLIRCNHSTAHILNHFLRSFIDTEQQGSLVDSEKCRFDFDSKKLSDEVLESLEDKINRFVSSNALVETTIHTREEVMGDKSIIKMSNEEYPDKVRVISMSNGREMIKEVCGGTHVSNTSEIKLVRLLSESGVKANVRRIVAVSNIRAKEADENAQRLKRLLSSGATVNVDCLLSLSDRREIELLNKKNVKKASAELKECIRDLQKGIDEELLSFKVSAMMKGGVFSYDSSCISRFSKKDILKSLCSLGSVILSQGITGFIFAKKDDEVLFCACTQDPISLLSRISEAFTSSSSRVANGLVQGSISSGEFDQDKLSGCLRK